MIASTKILLQPPIRGDQVLELSHAEAKGRLAFFLTYFDEVVPLAFNPGLMGQTLCLSNELEQEYVHSGAGRVWRPAGPVPVKQLLPPLFNEMATRALDELNGASGGFALASADTFEATNSRVPIDRIVLALEGCLPSPHHDTPLDEILRFKRDHEGELRAFHEALDDIYYSFGARPLDSLLPRFKENLDRHVEAVVKAYEGRQIKSYMGILRIGLKLAPALVGELVGHVAGVPGVGGLLGGTLGFLADKTKLPTEGNAVPKDFEYMLSGLAEGHLRAFPQETPLAADLRGPIVDHSVVAARYPNVPMLPSRGNLEGTRIVRSTSL